MGGEEEGREGGREGEGEEGEGAGEGEGGGGREELQEQVLHINIRRTLSQCITYAVRSSKENTQLL